MKISQPIDLSKFKYPLGTDNLNTVTGEVWLGAGSQSQNFDLGGFHSMTPLGGWPDPTPGLKYDELTLSYDLDIPAGFEWVHGGKFPGLGGNIDPLYTGHNPSYPAAGLNWTVRPMWAEGGRLRLYSWDMSVPAGQYPQGFVTVDPVLSPDSSYKFDIYIRMNAVGVSNGYASIKVNDKLIVQKCNCSFRTTTELGVDSVVFSVFYGGSGDEYAPENDQNLTIRNLQYSRVE
jgi:hypothetical protein